MRGHDGRYAPRWPHPGSLLAVKSGTGLLEVLSAARVGKPGGLPVLWRLQALDLWVSTMRGFNMLRHGGNEGLAVALRTLDDLARGNRPLAYDGNITVTLPASVISVLDATAREHGVSRNTVAALLLWGAVYDTGGYERGVRAPDYEILQGIREAMASRRAEGAEARRLADAPLEVADGSYAEALRAQFNGSGKFERLQWEDD